MKDNAKKLQAGLSVIEVMLAIVMFSLLALSGVSTIVHSFSVNRRGEEETQATLMAQEGLDAIRSIKNRGWSNLAAGTYGLSTTGNQWSVNGTSDSNGRFTRQVTISAVGRNGSGDIVDSGGTADSNVLKVVSTVSWDFYTGRNESVSLTTYMSNFRRLVGEAMLLYGDASSLAQPKFRIYNNSLNTFGTETSTGTSFTDTVAAKTFKVKTSPEKQELIAGYVNNTGTLNVLCFDGTNWTKDWTVTVGGNGTNDQRFAIAYETNTGDALIVYSTNTATTNELAYRTKSNSAGCGSANWSAATNINTVRTNGIVHWIKMERSPLAASDNIAVVWADNASDLSAMIWTGSSFTIAEPASAFETDLERVSASQDIQSFDIAYESLTGNLMLVWSPNGGNCNAGNNCIRYSRYTNAWAASSAIPTISDRGTTIDISANPYSNEIVLSAIDNSSSDLSTGYWSGSTWTGRQNVDTTAATPAAGTKLVANGWLTSGATTRYIQTYMDASGTGISWYQGSGSPNPSKESDFTTSPAIGNPKRWMELVMDPKNSDRLMFVVSDTNSDLFAKRLVMTETPEFTWTNADGAALEANLGQATTSPFGFVYWRN